MRVLVVDDEPSAAELLRIALKSEGLEVRAVRGLREALEVLRKDAFDWLVADGYLRPGSGFALAAAAKALQPEIRAVLVSAWYGEEDLRGGPIERVFTKPIDVDALIGFLRLAQPLTS